MPTTDDLLRSWYVGLAECGVTFIEIVREDKRPKRTLDSYTHLTGHRGMSTAIRWLEMGSAVGYIPGPEIWVLDTDTPGEARRVEEICLDALLVPLKVTTPSGGAHFVFTFPAGFKREGLKCHYLHPKNQDGEVMDADFKFGPRTHLVAPGTKRNGKRYEPHGPWRTPPVADPAMFLPNGEFWRKKTPFLVDERPLKDRLIRAKVYMTMRAPIAISGKRGRKTLAGVCAHLVVFLGLDPSSAFHFLTTGGELSWNARCIDSAGNPYPWSQRELWAACEAAVDAVPAAGVKAYLRQQKKEQLRDYIRLVKECCGGLSGKKVPVEKVRRLLGWFGFPELKSKGFGEELSRQGIKRIRALKRRLMCIPGLNYPALVAAIWAKRKAEKQGAERLAVPIGPATIKALKPQVEQIAS